MKILVDGNLKTQKRNTKMETRRKKPYCIDHRASKLGPCLAVSNQVGIGKYGAGTNSYPEHPSVSQNREKPILNPLHSPSPKKKQKPKRMKWTREEYQQFMTAFYQAFNEPKNNNTKCTYEV